MIPADISFPGLTDIRLSADEMFLSRKADGVVLEVLAVTSFNTSIQRVGWARYARNISNRSTFLFLGKSVSLTNMQNKI